MKATFAALSLFFMTVGSMMPAIEVVHCAAPPESELSRADIWFYDATPSPQAALLICPGMNGSAENFVRDPAWQAFARKHNLILAGLSFASETKAFEAGQGYPYADQYSGELIVKTMRTRYGKDLPFLLYGFSSGALLVEIFVQWSPERVITWCAHATGRYEERPGTWPPGIVSCGEFDHQRLGAALTHFKKGRATGNPLLWVELKATGHEWPEKLHVFVRQYFAAVMADHQSRALVDIDTHSEISEQTYAQRPALSGWLPAKGLTKGWRALME